mgnify:CR=1 FL=1
MFYWVRGARMESVGDRLVWLGRRVRYYCSNRMMGEVMSCKNGERRVV